MLKIRRPIGRLIFNMGIAIPGKTVFLIETAPWWKQTSIAHLTILAKTTYSGQLLWRHTNVGNWHLDHILVNLDPIHVKIAISTG